MAILSCAHIFSCQYKSCSTIHFKWISIKLSLHDNMHCEHSVDLNFGTKFSRLIMGPSPGHVTLSTIPISLSLILWSSLGHMINSQIHIHKTRRGKYHDCMGMDACSYTHIICDPYTECQISCQGRYSCSHSLINATASTSLILSCSQTDYASCDMTNIFCPDNGHSGPIRCSLYGATSTSIVNGIQVYTLKMSIMM